MPIRASSTASVKGAPTIAAVTSAAALTATTASVSFDPPSFSKLPITSYTVTSTPDNITATGATSPIIVTGLTPGTQYTFKVRASHSNGQSPFSEPSSSVTPAYSSTLVDNFNRSGSLGTSSDGSSSWTVLSGGWTADGSVATSSTNGVASVTLSGSTVTSMQVDIPDSGGGVGPAFWIQDAENYYAADVTYTTRTGSACNSYAFLSSPGGCNSSTCQNGALYDAYCTVLGNWGQVFASSQAAANAENNSTCSSFGASGAGVSFNRNASFCQTLGTATTYDTDFGVRKVSSGSTTRDFMTIASSQSSYTTIGSIKVSTSGTYVTAEAFTGQSLGGSRIQSFGSNQGGRVATGNVGIYKGPSSARQGSTLDNISAILS